MGEASCRSDTPNGALTCARAGSEGVRAMRLACWWPGCMDTMLLAIMAWVATLQDQLHCILVTLQVAEEAVQDKI